MPNSADHRARPLLESIIRNHGVLQLQEEKLRKLTSVLSAIAMTIGIVSAGNAKLFSDGARRQCISPY